MNIKILDSWLREYIDTKATVSELRRALSLCSVSIERVEKTSNDFVYDIEVTTNRPDLMSVIGIAREASVVLPQFGVPAKFKQPKLPKVTPVGKTADITIKNDPKLVNRVMAVVMEVKMGSSPSLIKKRLEASDIRSLNNIIDVTNYVMREIGHPAHVFDYDRLLSSKDQPARKLIIRKSHPGEVIVTLDNRSHTLPGEDIVADDGNGNIIDLLGIMGTKNSVVTDSTTRILFFLDNNNPNLIRKTSMKLGIRSEAAVLNEKGVDPELMEDALLRGIELYKQIADGKVISDIIDIYPNKPKPVTVTANINSIRSVIGVDIKETQIKSILNDLGFSPQMQGTKIKVTVPSFRLGDVSIEEDIIEEVARVYGYHNLPSVLPPMHSETLYHLKDDQFYWERRVKNALKYWGFTETYTYSMVSEKMLEGPEENALRLKNPLDEDHVFMRQSLIPSMLQVVYENGQREDIKLFEISNVYLPVNKKLPHENLRLGVVIKKENISFFELKGVVEQIATDMGVSISFTQSDERNGANILLNNKIIGAIEILDSSLADFELDFSQMLANATTTKNYKPIIKHPPMIEDLRVQISNDIAYDKIVNTITKQSSLIKDVGLLDVYEDKKTFRIIYQHPQRNLTNDEITNVREKIIRAIEKELKAKVV